MAITSIDDIASGLSVKQTRRFWKVLTAPKAAGAFHSAWLATGNPGAGGTSPVYTAGAGYACDKNTVGALLYSNAAVKNWLARYFVNSTQIATVLIADRLWSCSGMGYGISTYTVTTPGALPARITNDGLGCELWVEQFVGAGAATGSLTCNYVDPADQARSGVIPVVVSAPVIGQMQPVPWEAGGNGVKQLTSVANSATWTSGSWGMTILKTLAELEVPIANAGGTKDWAAIGLPDIPADACLMFLVQASSITAPTISGRLDIIDK